MKERPILMSAPMVRAILEGRKTQTRRVVKPPPTGTSATPRDHIHVGIPDGYKDDGETCFAWQTSGWSARCPYGAPDDRLWVRENGWERPYRTFRDLREGADTWAPYYYDADGIDQGEAEQFRKWGFKRRPSIHMPRRFSRITLVITEVRVERVHDISEADAMAEGVEWKDYAGLANYTAKKLYGQLWERINGPGSWALNPWVWVVEFQVTESPAATR